MAEVSWRMLSWKQASLKGRTLHEGRELPPALSCHHSRGQADVTETRVLGRRLKEKPRGVSLTD